MAVPTQAWLQSMLPGAAVTLDPAAFLRRLSSMMPAAVITITGSTVTVSDGQQSVSATLPAGVTFAAPAIPVRSIADANAPSVQSGKWA